jgi:YfiH family protein
VREVRHPNGVATWAFDLGPRVRAEVTTRAGGTSEGVYATCNLGSHVGDDPAQVRANRDAVAEALGVPALTIADQQHGSAVAVVDRELAGAGHDPFEPLVETLVGVDALATVEPGIGLAVLVADCAPVVLHDPVRGALAVVHAGRLGTVRGVIGAAVRELGQLAGSDPGDLRAGVGPCIGAPAYEIGGAALEEVRTALGDRHLTPTAPGHATFDLRAAVVERLLGAGVRTEAIEVVGATTDAAEDLFSDRAARPCGRFALVAVLQGSSEGSR